MVAVIKILGFVLCVLLLLLCLFVAVGVIIWLFKDEVKPEEVAYMDNDEFDYGHNVKHTEE